MPVTPTSFSNIKVGYISETDGYIQNVSISDANVYAESNPDTEFIFIDGDEKVRFLTINEVNALTPKDLLRSDPCLTGDQPCGPPELKFFGGGGGSVGKPSVASIASSAENTVNSVKERKSYGTSIEKLSSSKQGVKTKKVFAKPKTREKDLTNLVGYVNGQPYYGDFHIHKRDDGRVVKMVGIAHTTTPHEIIYDTVQESLD